MRLYRLFFRYLIEVASKETSATLILRFFDFNSYINKYVKFNILCNYGYEIV